MQVSVAETSNDEFSMLTMLPLDILCNIVMWLDTINIFEFMGLCTHFVKLRKYSSLIKQIVVNGHHDYIYDASWDIYRDCESKFHSSHILCHASQHWINIYWRAFCFRFGIVGSIKEFYHLFRELQLYDITRQQYLLYLPSYDSFSSTAVMATIRRLLPYRFKTRQPLYDIHRTTIELTGRMLNKYERCLFKPVRISLADGIGSVINVCDSMDRTFYSMNNYCMFQKKFNQAYLLYFWRDWVDWDKFYIAGSSVTAALTNMDYSSSPSHDVDIFSKLISPGSFRFQIFRFIKKLEQSISDGRKHGYTPHHPFVIAYEQRSVPDIKTFKITVSFGARYRHLLLQFVNLCCRGNPMQIVGSFDMDVCQCLFHPSQHKVLVTGAFIEAIRTGYIMCYTVCGDHQIFKHKSVRRMKKYISKGFCHWLIPKEMSNAYLQKSLSDNALDIPVLNNGFQNTWTEEYLLLNIAFDYYNVQASFIRHLQQ